MPDPKLIITVCTANICRSPMAEALLRHAFAAEAEPLKSARVISAGIAANEGMFVSENSRLALKKVGIDIAQHRSQPLTQALIDKADMLFCMTESHRAYIELGFDPPAEKVHLLRDFMPPDAYKEISDPYGENLRAYEICRDEIVEAIPSLLTFLRKTWGAAKA